MGELANSLPAGERGPVKLQLPPLKGGAAGEQKPTGRPDDHPYFWA